MGAVRRRPVFARTLLMSLALLIVLSACTASSTTGDGPESADLPLIDGTGIRAVLGDLTGPTVVNVWASWCLPCRSEAPLLKAAHQQRDDITFIGIDVEDDQQSAKEFIAEFGLDFQHYFDPDRAVPAELGGFGTPITYFVAADGTIVKTHSGILDEQTLALMLDELTG